MSLYEEQLEAKIKRQKSEITRLLAENAELKGLNSAICDVCKNDEFLKETAEQARAEGQEEAWELAQKLVLFESDGGFGVDELKEIFETQYWTDAFLLTYSEAITRVAEWERQKEEICVGDVLLSNETGNKCIVTRISNEVVTTLWNDGSCGNKPKDFVRGRFKKIGHIDVNTWLAQIGGESE